MVREDRRLEELLIREIIGRRQSSVEKVFVVAKKIVSCYHLDQTLPIFATARLEDHVKKLGLDLDDLTQRSRFSGPSYRYLSVGEKWELLTRALLDEKAARQHLKAYDNVEYMIHLEEGHGPADALDLLNLHPAIRKSSLELYKVGKYRECLKNAWDTVEAAVRHKSGRNEHGSNLMKVVFSPVTPMLRVSSRYGDQQGASELFSSSMRSLRNRVSHKETPEEAHNYDPYETLQELAFASLLCNIVDNSAPA